MIYNVNDPVFLKDEKFYHYCTFQMKNGNLKKILPELVCDLWFLLFLREIRKELSISFKYIFYGLIKNPKVFNRLLEINLVYGLNEYFKKLVSIYEKYESPNEESINEYLEKEEFVLEIQALDDFYDSLDNSINIANEAITYYKNNIVDLEFELNYNSASLIPGNLNISDTKTKVLFELYKDICNKKFFKKRLKEAKDIIKNGNVQPGFVVSISPLKIFVYSDEFSGGVMLTYPKEFVDLFDLKINQKVIFVNCYYYKKLFSYRYDLLLGDDPSKEFRDVIPLLALAFSEEENKINKHLNDIDEEMWVNVYESVRLYEEKFGDYARCGMEYFIHEK